MVKSRPRNRQRQRADATGKNTKLPSDPELAAIREKRILPVLKDLQSTDLKKRSAAASAIASIVEDQKCRKLFLKEQIVKILFGQTLTDPNLETKTAGWAILRNLALHEDADFCIHLYRQDILPHINAIVNTIIQTIESQDIPFSKLPKAQQTFVWSLAVSIISLLSSLSKAQDEIVEAVSLLPTISNFLFGLLSFEATPTEVQNEALTCLSTLAEDNKPLVEQWVENGDWLNRLMQLKDPTEPLNVAACGVLHNIFTTMEWSDHKTPIPGASDATLIPTLVGAMEKASSHKNGMNGDSGSSPDQVLQLALEIIASISTSLQETLEQGHEREFEGFDDDPIPLEDDDEMDADIKDQDDDLKDESGSDDEGGEEEDDEMTMDEIEADMDCVIGDIDDSSSSSPPSEQATLESLTRTAIPAILALASPATNPSAISALNNAAWTLSSIDFATAMHLHSIRKLWSSLAQQIWDSVITPVLGSNTADIELASRITSLAWAVSRNAGIRTRPDEHRKFMALYHASKSLDDAGKVAKGDAFQSLSVKCLGVLGTLALSPCPVTVNAEIGIFLLTNLPGAPPADTVEALNQIMDIYADEEFEYDEPVFWEQGFYGKLEELLPGVRKVAKSVDKRKEGELRGRCDEVVANLGRFLKYKKRERDGR